VERRQAGAPSSSSPCAGEDAAGGALRQARAGGDIRPAPARTSVGCVCRRSPSLIFLLFVSSLPDLIRQSIRPRRSIGFAEEFVQPHVSMDHWVKPGGDEVFFAFAKLRCGSRREHAFAFAPRPACGERSARIEDARRVRGPRRDSEPWYRSSGVANILTALRRRQRPLIPTFPPHAGGRSRRPLLQNPPAWPMCRGETASQR